MIEVRSGRVPRFCSGACRQRAYRARRRRMDRFDELARGRWVRAMGKRPVRVDGSPASSTDSSTWASVAEVAGSRVGDGSGVMLGGGLAAYDLDGCYVGGELAPWARKVLGGISEPVLFAERSASGRGLHVFVESGEAPGRRVKVPGGGYEFYSFGRFIRCTFNFDVPDFLS